MAEDRKQPGEGCCSSSPSSTVDSMCDVDGTHRNRPTSRKKLDHGQGVATALVLRMRRGMALLCSVRLPEICEMSESRRTRLDHVAVASLATALISCQSRQRCWPGGKTHGKFRLASEWNRSDLRAIAMHARPNAGIDLRSFLAFCLSLLLVSSLSFTAASPRLQTGSARGSIPQLYGIACSTTRQHAAE